MVRVRMFAAVRAAAGEAETDVPPGPLPEVLAGLSARYGPEFSRVLALCTVMIDGARHHGSAQVDVPDGAELALLPPFSGGVGDFDEHVPAADDAADDPADDPAPDARQGQRRARRRAIRPAARVQPLPVPQVLVPVMLIVAAGAPTWLYPPLVVLLAALAAVDLAALLGGLDARPILPAVGLAAVGAPVAAALRTDPGWGLLPAFVAAAVVAAFVLVLVARRRGGTVAALGGTSTVLLVTGFGAVGLLQLRTLEQGFRLVLALAVLAAVADGALGVARWLRPRLSPAAEVLVPLAALAAAAALLGTLLTPGVTGVTVARVVLVVLGAAVSGQRLLQAWRSPGATAPAQPRTLRAAEAAMTLLLAAPLVLVLAGGA